MLKYLLLLTTFLGGIFSTEALVTSSPTNVIDKYQTTCLDLINNFRKKMGVQLLKTRKSKINCTNKESKLNFESHMFHTRFGMCNENGQCECKGYQNVDNCINVYIAEGPGGGHYEILRSNKFTHVTCGKYKLPYGDGYYYTQNFYTVNPTGATQPIITTTKKPTTTTKQPSSCPKQSTVTVTKKSTITVTKQQQPTVTRQPTTTSTQQPTGSGDNTCVSLINKFRTSQGVAPLTAATSQQIQCANNAAKNDLVRGYHNSFGQCSERGQCECNGYRTLDQCINAYISEGPGGGHYEIIKSSQYTSVACGTDGNTFYTHNFY
jgi:hypothetical protein